ncbi:MAG: PepSY domain-containing protein [Weeksellaceae bacterium]|nr:PepSY domain-containing protein [Weeksellaceae bacterium]
MIICITGCLYAFKNQIIDFANYDHARVRAFGSKPQTPSQVQLELGKRNQILTSLIIHDNPARSWIVSYKEQNVDKTAYYDPYIGQVKGYPDTGSSRFFEIVLDLHRNLMMGNVGRQIVGVSALVFCFLLISGLVLWFPKKLKYLKQALTIKTSAKWARLNYDLHNTLGFYTCLVLFFIAVTGLYITYPWMKNALIVSLGGSSIAEATAIGSTADDDAFDNLMSDMIERQKEKKQKAVQVVSLDDIRNKADQKLNYKAVTSITLPNDENPRYSIIKTNTENFFGMMLPDELMLL